ncbi:hypothetical protein ACIBI9_32695 [Nonomuraea sp. NPDC050451]|uniref:hypothetical protein n=1 Tax=Nonomuraea sp. NPDC050451 TaxID=3364364 RepID=UPI00378BAA1F
MAFRDGGGARKVAECAARGGRGLGPPPPRAAGTGARPADVVALTIAEFFPRQVMHLRQILGGFPLLSPTTAD